MSLILVAAVLWGTCCAKTKQNEKIWGCVSFFSLFCLEILLRRRSKWERWRLHMLIAWLILEWEWMRLVSKSSHIWATTSWLESLEVFKLKTESICSSANCLFYFRRMCFCFCRWGKTIKWPMLANNSVRKERSRHTSYATMVYSTADLSTVDCVMKFSEQGLSKRESYLYFHVLESV